MARSVLQTRGMNRLALAALLVTATGISSAWADTYVGLGIGTAANGSSDVVGALDGYDRSGRLLVGTRISRISLEAQASRFDLATSQTRFDATQLGAGLKLSFPLGNNFEAFGRGGLARTWLSTGDDMQDAVGNGWFLGGGFEYRLNLGLTGASIFVDYQRTSVTVTNDRMRTYDTATGMWTVGATVSI